MSRYIIAVSLLLLFSSPLYASGQCVPVTQWVNTEKNETVAHNKVLDDLIDKRVVLIGEDHENVEHHRWQLSTITQIHSRKPKIAIGFEMFPRSTQTVLNKWVDGRISEKELLEQTEWNKIWAYNPEYYLPILRYARMHKIPVYALNVKRTLVSNVGKMGWDAVSDDEKEGVSAPAPAVPEYIEMMAGIYGHHAHAAHKSKTIDPTMAPEEAEAAVMVEETPITETPAFQNFIQGQLVWDRAMAEGLLKALSETEIELVVGIMGAGHIMPKMAVPYQLKSLKVENTASLMPWSEGMPCEELSTDMGQYAFGLYDVEEVAKKKSSKPKLGVYLEENELGPSIARLVPGSVAEEIGLKKDDIIVEVAGRKVKKVSEVIELVAGVLPGTWMPMTIQRANKNKNFAAKFPVSN